MPNLDACSISGGHFDSSLGRNLKLRLKVNQDFRDQSCAPDVSATLVVQNTYAHPKCILAERYNWGRSFSSYPN